jgi:UDP-N-acetylglucosamine 2-epimerase
MIEEYDLTEIVQKADNIKIVEPVSYLEMLLLEKHAKAIVTDSGGVQKEAYFAKVLCLTLRTETEWVETVEVGCNRLVNPLKEDLAKVIQQFQPTDFSIPLYGDGKASEKIAEMIVKFLSENSHL